MMEAEFVYETTFFDAPLTILIAVGISVYLLVVAASTLHVLTSFGFLHSNCTVWFSDSTVFVRPSIVAFKPLMTSFDSCNLDLNSSSANFSDLNAASEISGSVIRYSCSYK